MRWSTLARTSLAAGVAALAGAVGTDPSSRWYRTLNTPDWQPPAKVFPLVWTPLYGTIALSSAGALSRLTNDDADQSPRYRRALALNLVLNAGWSWVFWRGRLPWAAAAEAAALTVSSVSLVRRTAKVHPFAAAALVPYALWCGFATALTTSIARRNPLH